MPCSPPCLSLDLEVGKRDRRIHAFAAVRPDTGQRLVYRSGDLPAALARLDDLCEGAAFLVGHNLIAFDLPTCRRVHPEAPSSTARPGGGPKRWRNSCEPKRSRRTTFTPDCRPRARRASSSASSAANYA